MPDANNLTDLPPTTEQKQQQARRRLILAYKRCFTTESGKTVLADLKHQFGWDRWEADNSDNAEVIARRCSAKGPIFHIEKQMRTVFRDGKAHRPKPLDT